MWNYLNEKNIEQNVNKINKTYNKREGEETNDRQKSVAQNEFGFKYCACLYRNESDKIMKQV